MELNLENYHLKSLSFFDLLSEEDERLAKRSAVRIEYAKREVLFKEKSYSKGVYIVKKGKIKIFRTNSEGKQSIVYIYRKGDFFGYRPLVAGEPHPVTAAAIDQAVVSLIPKDVFMTMLNRSSSLARQLLLNLSREFSVWINKMTIFSQYAVKDRVALALLILNKVYQQGSHTRKMVAINIGRDDFAGFVGTAKETLVRMLRNFKDDGIITTRGTKIFILKPNQLSNFVSDL